MAKALNPRGRRTTTIIPSGIPTTDEPVLRKGSSRTMERLRAGAKAAGVSLKEYAATQGYDLTHTVTEDDVTAAPSAKKK